MNDEINAAIREARRRGRITVDAFSGAILDAPPAATEQPDPAPPRKGDWDGGARPASPPPSPDMNSIFRRDVQRQKGF